MPPDVTTEPTLPTSFLRTTDPTPQETKPTIPGQTTPEKSTPGKTTPTVTKPGETTAKPKETTKKFEGPKYLPLPKPSTRKTFIKYRQPSIINVIIFTQQQNLSLHLLERTLMGE